MYLPLAANGVVLYLHQSLAHFWHLHNILIYSHLLPLKDKPWSLPGFATFRLPLEHTHRDEVTPQHLPDIQGGSCFPCHDILLLFPHFPGSRRLVHPSQLQKRSFLSTIAQSSLRPKAPEQPLCLQLRTCPVDLVAKKIASIKVENLARTWLSQ